MKVNFSAAVVSALVLFFSHATAAEPIKASIEEEGNLYQFANQCYLMKLYGSDHYLSKTDSGFVFSQQKHSAIKIYMRPAALRVYLLFDQDKQYLIAEGKNLTVVGKIESEMTLDVPEKDYLITPAEWELQAKKGSDGYHLKNIKEETCLA